MSCLALRTCSTRLDARFGSSPATSAQAAHGPTRSARRFVRVRKAGRADRQDGVSTLVHGVDVLRADQAQAGALPAPGLMKQVLQAPRGGRAVVREVPLPACPPGGVLVRTEFSA